jgi:hypothetical protein
MILKIPSHGKRNIRMSDLRKWEARGWKFHKEISNTACEVQKEYSAWESFEIEARLLFKNAKFADVIEDIEDFYYTEFGPQLDVCGGVDSYFIAIDCAHSTKKEPVNLIQKLRDNHAKRERIFRALQKKYGDKYRQLVLAVCIQGTDPAGTDLNESEHLGIPLVKHYWSRNH